MPISTDDRRANRERFYGTSSRKVRTKRLFFFFFVLTIALVVVQCLRRRRTQFLVLIGTGTVRALHGSQKDPWWGKVEADTREDLG